MNYQMKYKFSFDTNNGKGWPPAEIDNTGEFEGACDALFVVSILRSEDGSIGYLPMSLDGNKNGPLSSVDIFSMWSMLGNILSKEEDLPKWQKAISRNACESVRNVILNKRKRKGD